MTSSEGTHKSRKKTYEPFLLGKTLLTTTVLGQVRPAGDLPLRLKRLDNHTTCCVLFCQYKLGIAPGVKRFMARVSRPFQVLIRPKLLLLYLLSPIWVPDTTNPRLSTICS